VWGGTRSASGKGLASNPQSSPRSSSAKSDKSRRIESNLKLISVLAIEPLEVQVEIKVRPYHVILHLLNKQRRGAGQ
jgi:hypothetical protein